MFNSLKINLILSVVGVLVVVLIFIFIYASVTRASLVESLVAERITTASRAARAYHVRLEEIGRMTASENAASQYLKNYVRSWNSGINQEEDRLRLLDYLKVREEAFDDIVFVITDRNGNVIVRTYEPDRYGDSGFVCPSITLAHSEGLASNTYNTTTPFDLGMSSTVPIIYQGEIIGSLSVVKNIGTDEFVDSISEAFNAEVSIFLGNVRIATTIRNEHGERAKGLEAPSGVAEAVLDRGLVFDSLVMIQDIPHYAYYFPLYGWENTPVGMFSVGFSNELALNMIASTQQSLVIAGIITLILISMLMLLLISNALTPLKALAQDAKQVAAGNIDVNFVNGRKDEVGQISDAFSEIVNTLEMLRSFFRKAQSNVKNGNILYQLDNLKMQGIFREILTETNDIIYEFVKLFGLISEPVIIIDRDCKVLYANEVTQKYIGKDICIGLHVNDFLSTDWSENASLKKAFETGEAQLEIEVQLQLKELYDFEVSFIPFLGDGSDGEIVAGLVLILTNITHIKESMRRERESATMNKVLLGSLPMFVELHDEQTGLFDCNEQVLDMFGLTSKQEYIQRHDEFFPEFQPCGTPSKEKLAMYNEKARKDGKSLHEFMYTTASGDPLPVEVTLIHLNLWNRSMFIAYNRDLRMIKSEMLKVQLAEEKAQLLLNSLPVACILLDENYEIIDYNPAVLKLFFDTKYNSNENNNVMPYDFSELCENGDGCGNCGNMGSDHCYTRKYFKENYISILFPNIPVEEVLKRIDKHCSEALRVFEQGKKYQIENNYISLSGENVPCEITLIPVQMSSETGYAVYMRDIREEKRRLAAEEESRFKTRFLAHMSHEIRTPINSVSGIAEIYLQKGNQSPEIEEAFFRIFKSSKLLLSIINDILDLSRIEAGRLEIIPQVYGVSSLIVDTAQLSLMQRGEKNIVFTLNVDENIPAFLIGDELRIKQIIINLLTNAFKYTREGTVSLSLRSDYKSDSEFNLIIIVSDTGQGMTEEQKNKIFNMEFLRFNEQANRTIEGTGLGSSIVYQLTKMMDGDITVDSTLGEGSMFTVKIPQTPAVNHVLGKKAAINLENLKFDRHEFSQADKIKWEPMPYGRVLVVDDLESNLYVAKQIMLPYKIDVHTVESGEEAIAKIEKGEVYDIIFMDHMMPGMDGIETTKKIQSMGYTYPIVALTANAVIGMGDIFLDNGFSDFLSKPIILKRIDELLLRYIRDKQPPEVIEAAHGEALINDNSDIQMNYAENLAESFIRDAEKTIKNIQVIMENPDWDEDSFKDYIIQVHNIKGALANIGRRTFSQEALILEDAAKNSDIETIRMATPGFIFGLTNLMSSLLPKESEITSETVTEKDRNEIRRLLRVIYESCQTFDINGTQDALKTLKQLPCPKEIKPLIDKISANILHGAFDEAAEIADQAFKQV